MTDDEAFNNMITTVSINSARLAARMALAINNGVSPNRVEAWFRSVVPSHPAQWEATLKMSKDILDVVLTEIDYVEAHKKQMEEK